MRTFKDGNGRKFQNIYILLSRKDYKCCGEEERRKYFTYDDTYDHNLYCGKLKVTNMDENGNIYDKYRVENMDTKEVRWFNDFAEIESEIKVHEKSLKQYEEEGLYIWYPIVNFHTYCYMARASQYFEMEYTHNGIPYLIQAEDPTSIIADDAVVSEEEFQRSIKYYDSVYEMFENYVFLDGVRLWDEKDKVVERAKEYFVYFT